MKLISPLVVLITFLLLQPTKVLSREGNGIGPLGESEPALLLTPDTVNLAPVSSKANESGLVHPSTHDVISTTDTDDATTAPWSHIYGRLPLHFEGNRGQVDEEVKFISRGRGFNLFLTSTEAVLALRAGRPAKGSSTRPGSFPALKQIERTDAVVLRMRLAGANQLPQVSGLDELPGKTNYFRGGYPNKWHANVPTYARVEYRDVYPGIDLIYYGNQRQLEYDFVVAPGADPASIEIAFGGADEMRLETNGSLVLQVGSAAVTLPAPIVYQEINGVRREISGGYVIEQDSTARFWLAAYDDTKSLVIDPRLVYSTFLGGSEEDHPWAVAVDNQGNAYVTGFTFSTDFPTANAPQPANAGSADVFVTKLNPQGSALVYSTFLGGSDVEEGLGIAVDSIGNAYVTGYTLSTDFPTANAIQGSSAGARDAFVTKLSPQGSALVYSTFLGGNGSDFAAAIAVDNQGNAYVTGTTTSPDFPTVNAIQGANAGSADVFVTKFDPQGSTLLYSTFLGSGQLEGGNAIAVDSQGNAYVTGGTRSNDFPTVNAIQAANAGLTDVFVTKFDPQGSTLLYSTFLGGIVEESGEAIAVDSQGNAHVTGTTSSNDFPVVNAIKDAKAAFQRDVFVTKLNPQGSTLLYSTFLGGGQDDLGKAIAVDSVGNTYVTGHTLGNNFPVTDPIKGGSRLNRSAFITKLNPQGSTLVYSTLLGGSGDDWGFGIAVDGAGNAYVTGLTRSDDFPLASPLQSANVLPMGFVSKVYDFGQGKCITAVNRGTAKVATAQRKLNTDCLKQAGKGVLPTISAEACLTADPKSRVTKRKAKNLAREPRKCPDAPLIGYTGAGNSNYAAVEEEINLLHDIFGPNLDSAVIDIAADRTGAGCQLAVIKAYARLARVKISQFLSCKDRGLAWRGASPIFDGPGLEGCLFGRTDSIAADLRGKVSAAVAKLARTASAKCNGVNLSAAFPGLCSGAGDFAGCVDERIECRVCLLLNAVDGLSTDCDSFDDGLTNLSCPP